MDTAVMTTHNLYFHILMYLLMCTTLSSIMYTYRLLRNKQCCLLNYVEQIHGETDIYMYIVVQPFTTPFTPSSGLSSSIHSAQYSRDISKVNGSCFYCSPLTSILVQC